MFFSRPSLTFITEIINLVFRDDKQNDLFNTGYRSDERITLGWPKIRTNKKSNKEVQKLA